MMRGLVPENCHGEQLPRLHWLTGPTGLSGSSSSTDMRQAHLLTTGDHAT